MQGLRVVVHLPPVGVIVVVVVVVLVKSEIHFKEIM
jgi:hypothetical protein